MINKNIPICIVVLGLGCLFIASGCRKEKYDLPDQPVDSYTRVYMPEAVNGPVVKTFKITDSVQTVTYGANFGGQGYPENDIPVTFTVDNTKVDSFNLANKTSYKVLPAGSYTLSGTTSTIPKGRLSTPPLSISFVTKGTGALEALKTYLLPVSITSASLKINEALRTTYYVIKAQPDFKDYPNFDRSQWQIIGFSSQEANGEGPTNGRAIFALDGNTATYWHTQWQGASPVAPHFVVIDMGAAKTMHGLSFVDRQGTQSGKPNEVNVLLSTDNVTWTNAGTFNLQNIIDLQPQFLPDGFNKTARYFKVIINSSYSASYTHLAELNAF